MRAVGTPSAALVADVSIAQRSATVGLAGVAACAPLPPNIAIWTAQPTNLAIVVLALMAPSNFRAAAQRHRRLSFMSTRGPVKQFRLKAAFGLAALCAGADTSSFDVAELTIPTNRIL
jgi:hypothetical protein